MRGAYALGVRVYISRIRVVRVYARNVRVLLPHTRVRVVRAECTRGTRVRVSKKPIRAKPDGLFVLYTAKVNQ